MTRATKAKWLPCVFPTGQKYSRVFSTRLNYSGMLRWCYVPPDAIRVAPALRLLEKLV